MNIRRIKQFFCVGEFTDIPVKVMTDAGQFTSKLKGQIILQAFNQDNAIRLRIKGFNATADSVRCKDGSTGLISLGLIHRSDRVKYAKSGDIEASLKMNLHYPLITKIHGFPKIREKEKDNFVPYVARVSGKIIGKFDKKLDSIIKEYKLIDSPPPSTSISIAVSLVAEDYYVNKLELTLKTGILIPLALERSLRIQPVFVRSGPSDTAPTGWAFDTLMENARVMWRKCCINLDVLPPIFIDDAAFKNISTQQDIDNLRGQINDDPDAIEIFVASSLGSLEASWGGGVTFDSGTANAQIVTCDSQLEVHQGTTEQGAINYNHYAHELGHVLSLLHPGLATSPPMAEATDNTVMEPSGFYADNPHAQSKLNCDNADNPILRWRIVKWSRRCRQNPEL